MLYRPLFLRLRVQWFQRDAEGLGGSTYRTRRYRRRSGPGTVRAYLEWFYPDTRAGTDMLDTFAVGVKLLPPTGVAADRLDQFKGADGAASEHLVHLIAGFGRRRGSKARRATYRGLLWLR